MTSNISVGATCGALALLALAIWLRSKKKRPAPTLLEFIHTHNSKWPSRFRFIVLLNVYTQNTYRSRFGFRAAWRLYRHIVAIKPFVQSDLVEGGK